MVETSYWAKAFRIGDSNANSVEIEDESLVVGGLRRHSTPLGSVAGLHLDRGLFWNAIRINTDDGRNYHLKGLPKGGSYKFLREYVTEIWPEIDRVLDQVKGLTNSTHYAANHQIQAAIQAIDEKSFLLKIPARYLNSRQRKGKKQVERFRKKHQKICKSSNTKFISLELNRFNEFFDTVEPYPLTDKQREAIVINQDNNLVIAGAGSGKTSVIAAKVSYLIKKELCQPEDILLLAFSVDARKELEERIQSRSDEKFRAKTFHALGLDIIGEVEGKKPSVSTLATDSKKMTAYIHSAIKKWMSDKEFAAIVTTYFQSFFAPYRSIFEFKNLGQYYDYIRSHEIRSLNGDLVKSYEECEIANFFFLNGISYEYERRYEFDTATPQYRQYEPDFFLTDYGIYIEHFGIDREGNTPDFVDKDAYNEGIEWKRQLHQLNKTTLVETFSFEKSEGILLSGLEFKLKENEVAFEPISPEAIFEQLNQLGAVDTFSLLVGTFLNHFKSGQRNIRELREEVRGHREETRFLAFLQMFETIYNEYENALKKEGKIDFNDMISKAKNYVRRGEYKPDFSYILVDEFQDISVGRAKLVKSLTEEGPHSTLFCVGDDWQSIYRFAGSDISIMRNFEDEFGVTETSALDRTFRFNNQISNVACDFILKNPMQISKEVKPHTKVDEPRVLIGRPFGREDDLLIDALSIISNETNGEEKTVLVLARYWFVKPDDFDQITESCPDLKITFKSVHSSKGLEADYVIVLGLCSGKYGFPSEISDDPILDIVLAQSEAHPNAEERRVFYVAMTRAKEAVFLVADRENTSSFIKELEESDLNLGFFGANATTQVDCPDCETGRLIKRDGPYGVFYSCSHFPYCKFSMNACSNCGEGLLAIQEEQTFFECSNDECSHNEEACPSCGDGRLTVRVNRNSNEEFLGCTNYQSTRHCEYTRHIS